MTPARQHGRRGASVPPARDEEGGGGACARTPPDDSGLTAYEAARAARIAANAARLAALGIPGAAQAMAPPPPPRPRPGGGTKRPRPAAPPPTTRALRPRPPPSAAPQRPPPTTTYAFHRARRPAAPWSPSDLDPVPRTVAAPFTTRCGSLTVHSLGRVIHAAPDADASSSSAAWWSSSGARFRHAYTAGYAATRHRALGGRDFKCEVEECPATGLPVFRVTDLDRRVTFTGPSPTRPWTTHCLQTGTGVRVSGPLFYGFCEALVQAGLAALVEKGQHELRSPSLGSGAVVGAASPSPSPVQARRVRRRATAAA